jgi:RNA polymerase sigma-70 factor (ECF subfamily)
LADAALPGPSSDADLARRASLGDEPAFETIMRRHNRLLFRTARSILRNDADAEDALQDAYLHAWRALAGFRSDARLSTWLVRIVINEALARLRRHVTPLVSLEAAMESTDANTQLAMHDHPDQRPESSAMRAQLRRQMEARIDKLPEAFRTVFVLRAVEELDVDEVAAALQLPEATVRTRFFRARRLLRDSLAREVDGAMGDAFWFDGVRCDRIVRSVLTRLAALR